VDFKAPDWSHGAVTGHHTLFHSHPVWSYNLYTLKLSLNSTFSMFFLCQLTHCFVMRAVHVVLSQHKDSQHAHDHSVCQSKTNNQVINDTFSVVWLCTPTLKLTHNRDCLVKLQTPSIFIYLNKLGQTFFVSL